MPIFKYKNQKEGGEKLIQKTSFSISDVESMNFDNYNTDEFAVAKISPLSTRPNSHGLVFSDEVFRKNIDTILGKWVVAKMNYFGTDAEGHEPDEVIMGNIPANQEVEIIEDEDGYQKAYVYAIISKVYANKFYKMFKDDEERAVSIEFTMHTENDNPTDDVVLDYNIVGVTVLGHSVKPSVPDANIQMIRFSEKDAENYFGKIYQDISPLTNFEKKGKEENIKMQEVEFSAVNIGNMWDSLYNALSKKYEGYSYAIKDIYEEGGKKFALIKKYGDDALYRLDFSLTEEGLTLAEEIVKVEVEFIETNEIQKFAEPENVEDYRKFAENNDEPENKEDKTDEPKDDENTEGKEGEMSDNSDKDEDKPDEPNVAEMQAQLEELQRNIEEKDNIIMEYETELADLRAYKQTCMEADRASKVEAVMSEVAKFMDKEAAEDYRKEGLSVEFSELDAWTNKVKASVFDKSVKHSEKNEEFTRMSGVQTEQKENHRSSLWD